MMHSICQQIWKTQQWPQNWKRSVFIPIPKKGNAKECSNYCTIALISQASKVMLKILQARLKQYMNQELPDVQAGFRKGRGARDQIVNIHWTIWKAREIQKFICFIDYTKASDYVDHSKLWKILKEMRMSDHLTCLLRNLYAGQEATVRTGHGKTDWFQIGKGVCQDYILLPAYLTYMQSTSWEMLGWMNHKLESRFLGEMSITSDMQMTPPLWQKVKKNERASWWKWKRRVRKWLKLSIHKTKIMASSPITSCPIDSKTMKTINDKNKWQKNTWQNLFSWVPKSLWTMTAAMKLKDACSLEEKLRQT